VGGGQLAENGRSGLLFTAHCPLLTLKTPVFSDFFESEKFLPAENKAQFASCKRQLFS
jgi:hypothetical protein